MNPKIPRAKRHSRRFLVDFWERGKGGRAQKGTGYTTNISSSGMFLATQTLFPVGSRVRAKISNHGQSFVIEAQVTRSRNVPSALRSVQPSGLGLRFLQVADLVQELMVGVSSKASASASAGPLDKVFPLRFKNAEHFLEIFERDIENGGLFIMTPLPAELHQEITVELAPPGESAPLRFPARVVHRVEPKSSDDESLTGSLNLMAGMGVELVCPEAALESLRPIVERLRQS